MRGRLLLLLLLGALAASATVAIAAADARPPPAPTAAAKRATVTVRKTKLGRILVDGAGRTLYLFRKDKGTKSECAGACAKGWPPLMTSGKPVSAQCATPFAATMPSAPAPPSSICSSEPSA